MFPDYAEWNNWDILVKLLQFYAQYVSHKHWTSSKRKILDSAVLLHKPSGLNGSIYSMVSGQILYCVDLAGMIFEYGRNYAFLRIPELFCSLIHKEIFKNLSW